MAQKGYLDRDVNILSDDVLTPYIRDENGIVEVVNDHIVEICADNKDDIKEALEIEGGGGGGTSYTGQHGVKISNHVITLDPTTAPISDGIISKHFTTTDTYTLAVDKNVIQEKLTPGTGIDITNSIISVDYSDFIDETEVNTHVKWANGKDIYKFTFEIYDATLGNQWGYHGHSGVNFVDVKVFIPGVLVNNVYVDDTKFYYTVSGTGETIPTTNGWYCILYYTKNE